ncbi:DUF6768 family protein [uncultured Shimia sp.]|uniref:DUF6768 family protein n=1 Tax=uncultured Shimia sp. TaxID=573152 RepID=UPI0025F5B71C|nr:DUF6768 family protein [uncultured Shimia sp.]
MDYLDIRIKELSNEQQEHLLRASQPFGLLGLTRLMRQGRIGWLFWVMLIGHVGFLILGISLAMQFSVAVETHDLIRTGIGGATSLIIAVQLLVGLAPHLHAERTKRRLKRLEILILSHNKDDSSQ